MSDEEVLDKLYRFHTSWIIMAERLMPAYYPMTAEDIVQEIYLKRHTAILKAIKRQWETFIFC